MVQLTGGRRLAAAEAAFVRVNQWLVIALMSVMATLVFANVLARYLFNYSLIWVEELTQYQMIWIAYLGAGLALREGRHVAVDLFEQALAPGWRRSLRVALGLAMLAFLVALAFLGVRIAQFTWNQETPVLNVPAGVPYLGVPIGAAMCALHLVLVFRDFVEKRFEHGDALEAHAE
jgi:TRAP-type C4-dicarboxylate transport system permease small subunit